MTVQRIAAWSGFFSRVLSLALPLGGAGLATNASSMAHGEPVEVIAPERLQRHLEQMELQLGELVAGDDLLDSLHFGWSDRPYARATLAVLTKSSAVLARELRLRRMGNGALPDETVSAIVHWQDQAIVRARSSPGQSEFRPHRLRLSDAPWDQRSGTPSLYGMIDATTITRHDQLLGDLDLIAALGFRAYAWTDRPAPAGLDPAIHRQRANALGIATVRLLTDPGGGRSTSRSTGESLLTVTPVTLTDLVTGRPTGPEDTIGISDPPFGESWAARMARRALARTATGNHRRFITAGWTPPLGGTFGESRTIPAAMWVDAVEGQSLGLIAGWRDLRDGSANAYASLLPFPDRIEAIALTALDLIRLGRPIAALRSTPRLAIAVDAGAVDSGDGNSWARWIEPVWTELLRSQISFDVVSKGDDPGKLREEYWVMEHVSPNSAKDPESLVASWAKRLAEHGESRHGVTACDPQGSLAPSVVVRQGDIEEKGWCLFIANLSASDRVVQLPQAASMKQVHDLIAGEVLPFRSREVPLGPWQVRLLSQSP